MMSCSPTYTKVNIEQILENPNIYHEMCIGLTAHGGLMAHQSELCCKTDPFIDMYR